MRRIVIWFFLVILVLVIASGIFPWIYKQIGREPFAVEFSPDQRFRLEYYAIPFVPFRPYRYVGMGCTDCPGFVRLVDNTNDRILEEKYFETRHEVSDGVEWQPREVVIKLFAGWPLPSQPPGL